MIKKDRKFLPKLRTSYGYTAYFFILPAILILGLYSLYPMIYNIILSFFELNIAIPDASPIFVGITNFISMWTDENFIVSLKNSLIFSAITVTFEFIFGLWFAVLLSQEIKGNSFFRSIFLIPLAFTPVVTGMLWKMILNPSNGLFNYFLGFINIPSQNWFATKYLAFFSICLVSIWMWTPFVMIIFVAGLKSIDTTITDAALVDGASSWQRFWRVTFPIMSPVIIVTLLLRLIDSLKVFDILYVLTGGGPGISTEVMGLYIYKQGLKYFYGGKASAVNVLFVLVILVLAFFAIRKTLREE